MPNLNRFHMAQQKKTDGYVQAKKEMSDGRKTGHWIWYILPQLNIFGFTSTSQTYGIVSFEEACEYLRDETLFNNYLEIIKLIEEQLSEKPTLRLDQLMGGDDVKLLSSLTLFRGAASFLNAQEGNPKHDFKDLENRCNHIFAMVAKHGSYPCMQTESYLEFHMQHAPKSSVLIEPPVSITTTPDVRPKISLFDTPIVPIQPPAHKSPVIHAKPPHDESLVTPPKTILDESSIPVPITPVEDTGRPVRLSPLISSLEGYIDMRSNEWSFHYNFLGIVSLIYLIMDTISGTDHFHEKSRGVKISAATKLKQILDPTAPELSAPLTHAEWAALQEGRLGGLVAEQGSLEQLIQNAPEKQIHEPSSNHFFNF